MADTAGNSTWDEWWPSLYSDVSSPRAYPGTQESYQLAGKFLEGPELVEEWGCATTYGRRFIFSPYRGIDGGPSPFVDEVVDLSHYKSQVPKALIRHVLEHNWNWRDILKNFLDSFTDKGVVILFIPLGDHDINRSFEHREGEERTPPGLQLDEVSFMDLLNRKGLWVEDVELDNDTPPFNYERVFYLTKREDAPHLSSVIPRCTFKGCVDRAVDQVRSDFVIKGNRFEYAFNACYRHADGMLHGLYSLQVPEVDYPV